MCLVLRNISLRMCYYREHTRSRDSVVSIATGYGLDDQGVGFRVSVGSRIFCSPRRPPNLLTCGYGGSFPGVKRPRREADHSPPTDVEVNKMWIYTSIPHPPSWRSA
jgi:hypothetical protein